MEFHNFTRKALQALCKQNGIPANITNVAMADSLAALQLVEGLQELLSQSPEKSMSVLRTAAKTTIRRKAEPESSQPMARTTARHAAAVPKKATDVNEEMTELPPKTPAAVSTRRRAAPAGSAHQKSEVPTETLTSVQRPYSTRRSVRLLGKTMSKMSLDKESDSVTSSIEELSSDTINCSEQSESSVVKGSDMQTLSDMDMSSKGTDACEVSSELKSVGQVVDDPMPKSELSASKLALAVNVISEAMDESIEESSVEADETADDKGAQDLVVVKESEDVTDVKTVEPIKVTLSATSTKSPASKSLDMNVEAPKAETLADYSGKFDFEEESEDESAGEEAVNEPSSELQQKMDAPMEEASEEEQESDDDSTEGGESSEEEQESDDDSTEGGESSEEDDESDEEVTGEEESDDDITEGESSEDEDEDVPADKSEMQCAQVAVVTQTSPPLLNIATQFPRPSSAKSSDKKQSKIAMYNEESFDTSNAMNKEMDLEGAEMKKDEAAAKFKAKSLRQLKKILKNKLSIVDSEEPRVALKEVSENQMAIVG